MDGLANVYIGMGPTERSPDRDAVGDAAAAKLMAVVPTLTRLAVALVGQGPKAEDLVFDTVATLIPVLSQVKGDLAPYARKLLINRHIDILRREAVATAYQRRPEVVPPDRHPFEQVDQRLDLEDALNELSPRTRAVLVLRYFEDWSVAQVADALSLPAGSVRRIAHEGIAVIRSGGTSRVSLPEGQRT